VLDCIVMCVVCVWGECWVCVGLCGVCGVVWCVCVVFVGGGFVWVGRVGVVGGLFRV